MITKRKSKINLKRAIFGVFFVIIGIFGLLTNLSGTQDVYADPVDGSQTTSEEAGDEEKPASSTDGCKNSLGPIGWLVCPTTGKIAEAIDWLYEKIEDILIINPVEMKDGTPIYEIWKYCLGLANIVFIIFLLVVIYSQITGFGISNYGIKKALPKLIVAAILVNLSFLICSLAVDVSNIVGHGLRGAFNAIEETVLAAEAVEGMSPDLKLSYAQMYGAMGGGTALAVGGTIIAFETGAIWMLIPVVLGAIVAVVAGLITIALRQAVVVLLIMIAPLAIVANILPNTEDLFKKWKKLLTQMLVFYPAFSLLIGASSLAGFAIIASAKDGFAILLGMAVQIFPLFFAPTLMKMSGTFLGTINSRMQGLAAKPLAANRNWADSRRNSTKYKNLASARPTTPSLRLMQFMTNRRINKDAETAENMELVKNRAMAYRARKNYDEHGVPTKKGEEAYENQARIMSYQQIILRDRNNMEKGFGTLRAVNTHATAGQRARLAMLDRKNVEASDSLKVEQARSEKIQFDNTKGFYERVEKAMQANADKENGFLFEKDSNGNFVLDENGERKVVGKKEGYNFKFQPGSVEAKQATDRYKMMDQIMEGNTADIHFAAAGAAQSYNTQKKLLDSRNQTYFSMLPPTRDVVQRLNQLTNLDDAADKIDSIIPGLRVLNDRGDDKLVLEQIENILKSRYGVNLGTHAAQALASFLMFEVKGNDPALRRLGKYINLETAHVYNENTPDKMRQNKRLSFDEFVTGEYEDWEKDHPEIRKIGKSKKSMTSLLEGTSFDDVEREAFDNIDTMLMGASTDGDGNLNVSEYLNKRSNIEKTIGPAFTSASLKYLSGSEQIKNAVKFLTGYEGDTPLWEKGKGPLDGSMEAKQHYRGSVINWIKSLTPDQVLKMRSDYREAITEHMLDEYFENNPEERQAYQEKMAEIQTRYGDEDIEVAKKKRETDINNLKLEMAGKEFRKILGETGKLRQILVSHKSGRANNAKDFLRKLVSLDDIDTLRRETEYYEHQNDVKKK